MVVPRPDRGVDRLPLGAQIVRLERLQPPGPGIEQARLHVRLRVLRDDRRAAAREIAGQDRGPVAVDGRDVLPGVAETLERITAALDGGASKASVCRTFKVPRSTLLGTLARIGWTAPAKV